MPFSCETNPSQFSSIKAGSFGPAFLFLPVLTSANNGFFPVLKPDIQHIGKDRPV
jgi:hypothetical protein